MGDSTTTEQRDVRTFGTKGEAWNKMITDIENYVNKVNQSMRATQQTPLNQIPESPTDQLNTLATSSIPTETITQTAEVPAGTSIIDTISNDPALQDAMNDTFSVTPDSITLVGATPEEQQQFDSFFKQILPSALSKKDDKKREETIVTAMITSLRPVSNSYEPGIPSTSRINKQGVLKLITFLDEMKLKPVQPTNRPSGKNTIKRLIDFFQSSKNPENDANKPVANE